MDKTGEQKVLAEVQSIPRKDGEAVFNEPWEARAFAMAVELNEKGVFSWSEWGNIFSANLKVNSQSQQPASYYRVWMKTLEQLVEAKEISNRKERLSRQAEWQEAAERTPHGRPIVL